MCKKVIKIFNTSLKQPMKKYNLHKGPFHLPRVFPILTTKAGTRWNKKKPLIKLMMKKKKKLMVSLATIFMPLTNN